MADRPIELLTLRELFTIAELQVRELTEHLRQSFQPQLRDLEGLVRTYGEPEARHATPDSSVRTQAASLLISDDYSQKLFRNLNQFLMVIDEKALQAITVK